MKTAIKTILIVIVLSASAGQAFAYPPDNAAVLYYKAFMLLEEPNDAVGRMLRGLSDGNNGLNEQIRQYVEKNRKVIDEIITAAEIKNCDWGLDFSEWFDTELPHLSKCRQMAYILAADAKIFAEKGDYGEALERCITIHNMGIHVGDDTIIQRLVGMALGRTANGCIVDILPLISDNSEMLEKLRWRLVDISSRCPSLKVAVAKEAEIIGKQINRKTVLSVAEVMDEPCDVTREILQADDEYFAMAREYYQGIMAKVQSYFDLPYSEAIQRFEDLDKETEKDRAEKPEAFITRFLFPAISRIRMIEARDKTHLNAVLTGIDIYLIRAKTGKLPDELPAGLPKDMFSGKDFLYEKTDDGFTLTGQGKDLDKEIVHQYEFKVVK